MFDQLFYCCSVHTMRHLISCDEVTWVPPTGKLHKRRPAKCLRLDLC